MARMWLMAALLLLSASAGSSLDNPVNPQVDQNKNSAPFQRPDETQIAQIVNNLWNRLNEDQRKLPMFSLAVSIPYDDNNNKYNVSKLTFDPKEVKKAILGCDVYTSERMVAATLLKWPDVLDNEVRTGRADHAEYRVLPNFNTLKEKTNNKQDFLLFYVYASPCDKRCASTTNYFSILDSINVIKKWANYAVVFSKVFKPKIGNQIPAENLKGALERLGAQIGLQNIYRCDGSVPCTRCSKDNNVPPYCYSDDPQHAPNAASTSVNVLPGGKANVPPQTGKKITRLIKEDGGLLAGAEG